MPLLQIVVLALIQGITEFLPVSSSGHLALLPHLTGWEDQGLAMDVAVHVGTLGAVIAYLWRDVLSVTFGVSRLITGKADDGARLAGYVLVATIPVLITGFLVSKFMGDALRSATVIGWAFIVFGIILYISDRTGSTARRVEDMTISSALIIGLAQICALIPGASRAGTTMTMGRFLGFNRQETARFSMLMAIPAIAGAGLLQGMDVVNNGDSALLTEMAIAAAFSFVTAFVAIVAMMGWLRRQSYTPFVIYRVALGIIILVVAA